MIPKTRHVVSFLLSRTASGYYRVLEAFVADKIHAIFSPGHISTASDTIMIHERIHDCRSNEKLIQYLGNGQRKRERAGSKGQSNREKGRKRVHGITRFGLRGKGDPSCSQPRNNVGGLWFFIRARSHNGERVIHLRGEPKAFSDVVEEEEEGEEKVEAFVPTSNELEVVRHFFSFHPLFHLFLFILIIPRC